MAIYLQQHASVSKYLGMNWIWIRIEASVCLAASREKCYVTAWCDNLFFNLREDRSRTI